jgi:hypothetical protein
MLKPRVSFYLKVTVNKEGNLTSVVVEETFDYQGYIDAQKRHMSDSPVNRNAVREKYPELQHLNDDDLIKYHQHELGEVFFENGGAIWAVEHIKPLFVRVKELPQTEVMGFNCVFLQPEQHCRRCVTCAIEMIRKK